MTDKQIIIDGVDISKCEFYWREKELCNNGNLTSDCQENKDCLYKKYKRKEQECEALQMSENEAGEIIAELKAENDKLKQTLAEIKEIAEKQVKRAPDGETFSRPEIKQILQKISEVNNDNK